MPEFSPEIAPGFSSSKSLLINALFNPSMQGFIDLIREKQEIKYNLNDLKEKIESDPKARRYPNIVEKRLRLNQRLDKNDHQLNQHIQGILTNHSLLTEWRTLPLKSVELIQRQSQLAEQVAEESIAEEEAQKFKAQINAELDVFFSESIHELYQRDFQAILNVGISESDLSYLGVLSQLDNTIRQQAEDKIADYYMQAAEKQIAKNSFVTSSKANTLMEKSIINNDSLSNGITLYEDPAMPAVYTADTPEQMNELVLNGADPVKESQCLESTPLAQHFASRYVLQQELNKLTDISLPSIKAQLNPKFAKKVLVKQYSEEKQQYKTDLNHQIATLTAEIEGQTELKIDLEGHIQALNQDAKEQKFKLKNDLENQIEASKKKTKGLTPESKVELTHQFERLKIEADALELELKNNAALIDAHLKAIVLRDVDAQLSDYPDIAGKERFLQTWNNCKQEVKALQQTQLSENCSAYDFLTKDLAKLSALKMKTMKWATAQFPEYKPLLQMQSDLLDNYRLVQGPLPVTSATELKTVDTLNASIKVPAISEMNVSENQEMPSKEKKSTENNSLIQRPNRSRLTNAGFFNVNVPLKSPSVPQKTLERSSRLNGSILFNQGNSRSKLADKASQVKTLMVSRLIAS